MAQSSNDIPVYLEIGKKRTFAGALDWPGWCRSGRDEAAALKALFDYAPRYAAVLSGSPLAFQMPPSASAFTVLERLQGNATTDFGAPDFAPAYDARPFDRAQLQRSESILKACWRAFDRTARAAAGKELRKGPRGGGRELEAIVGHVQGAEEGYLSRLAWKVGMGEEATLQEKLERTRQAILEALASAAAGGLPERGPRGGLLWRPGYFVRRVAWHVLDHAWEIEDRLV
jgi:hypothetical protein